MEPTERMDISGAAGPIQKEQVKKAFQTYQQYERVLKPWKDRIINAEEWWKERHWERFSSGGNSKELKSTSAWLFNSIINKHADFMDNIPMPAILPREESDKGTAKLLTDVVPVILEQNGFAKTYSDCCWDKPKFGTAVYAVLWDKSKENGLGDVSVNQVDLLTITWEPMIKNIQDSRNVFITTVCDVDLLKNQYPQLTDIKGGMIDRPKYMTDQNREESNKVMVFDWYYKKMIGSRTVVHFCKFVEEQVIYASENDSKIANGWYQDGKYPFVFDSLFPEKESPAGFGYLDVMIRPQEYIDRLDQVILMNGLMNKPRYFASNGVNLNISEFTDLSKDIVNVSGNVDDSRLRQIQPPQISDVVLNQRENKINELKETSGNRDFSQGSTQSGVTAASAIAALQEAGSKLARDMIKGTYMAYEEIVTMVIERIRQFYDLPRCYRITSPNGSESYVQFDNEGLKPIEMGVVNEEIAMRRPVFDIKVSAQKASAYSRIAQNELAKELFQMGLFNPQLADQAMAVVKMMDFDRREEVMKTIQDNGMMYQKLQQQQEIMIQMAKLIAQTTGNTAPLEALQATGVKIGMTNINTGEESDMETNSLGAAVKYDDSQAGKARARVKNATEVRS